ncbi:Trehalose-6-P synthase/phosphatase complex synthase subunit, partial [Coemansia sp. RSA 678]
ILWLLFHYHPREMIFEEAVWDAYQHTNQAFAKALLDMVNDGNLVWIQDYHLMLLPHMLRGLLDVCSLTRVKIGWFLHTPFPSSELYRILPVRRSILEGVLAADLLGFHTYDYAQHFLSSCMCILGLVTVPTSVEAEGHTVHVGTFLIGFDPGKFAKALQTDTVQRQLSKLEWQFNGACVVVGIDWLDYIKGVLQKFLAFEHFLSEHPEHVGHMVLMQVAVPSRGDVEEYRQLIASVNELVGRINGRFGTVEYTPIHFLHKSVTFDELVSLYAMSDVCLITSTRDGMNLISYEYVASQQARHGVLVLSEFAGAAQSLNGALIVNSWNIEEVSDALHQALAMAPAQREANFNLLYKYVNTHTVAYWGVSFINKLKRGLCVLMLDYDGTLSATRTIPDFVHPSPQTLRTLRCLAKLPCTLVAEHGLFYRHLQAVGQLQGLTQGPQGPQGLMQDAGGWTCLVEHTDPQWRKTVLPLFQHYTEHTPGSFIEEKEVDLTWHYRNTDPELLATWLAPSWTLC